MSRRGQNMPRRRSGAGGRALTGGAAVVGWMGSVRSVGGVGSLMPSPPRTLRDEEDPERDEHERPDDAPIDEPEGADIPEHEDDAHGHQEDPETAAAAIQL